MGKFLHSMPMAKKLGLLAAAALFVAAAIGVPPSAQAACHNWTEYVIYYSDASKTQEVGWCEFACFCQTSCDGQQTPYTRRYITPGCL
jgi:hypothetical protein